LAITLPATVAAQLIGFLILLIDAKNKQLIRRFSFTLRIDFTGISAIFNSSTHLFFRSFLLLSGFLIAGSVAARMGTSILAAHEIAMKLWLLGSFTIDAFAVAGQALAGKYAGAGNGDKNSAILFRNLLWWGAAFGMSFAVLYGFFANTIISFFTNDMQVAQTVQSVFFLVVIFQPISAVTFVLDGILIGLEKTKYLMQMMIMGSLIFISIAIIAYLYNQDLIGIWWGLTGLMIWRFFTNLKPVWRIIRIN